MYTTIKIVNIILPFLYLLTFGVYLFDFIKGIKQIANSKHNDLAFWELEARSCPFLAVFLSLFRTRITGQQAGLF